MQLIVDDQSKMAEVAGLALFEIKQKKRSGATVLALYGDLGAGKTTFVQALGKLLGIQESMTSPTFMLLREYMTTDPLVRHLSHIDAYRLSGEEELHTIGWDALMLQADTLVCVEWADRIENRLPIGTLRLHFEHHKENERIIKFD